MNNKILQGKVNKLSQTAKNGFNNNPININNNNQNINNANTLINKENKENKYNNFNYINGIFPKTLDKNNHQIQDIKITSPLQIPQKNYKIKESTCSKKETKNQKPGGLTYEKRNDGKLK